MLQRLLLWTFGILFIPLASYAGIYGVLSGKVASMKGEPVPGATLKLAGSDRGGVSRPDGKYIITKITAGTYDVKVTAVGYAEFKSRVTITADQTAQLDVKLTEEAVKSDTVFIVARRMVDPTQIGHGVVVGGDEAKHVARETIQSTIALSAGVNASGSGFNVRGGRSTDNQFRIDGLDVGDQFTGGFGGTDLNYFPTVSPFATEETQVITGGFAAEYGNALSGVFNSVTKTGRSDRYEGYLRYRTGVAPLYGSAGNGLKYEGSRENTMEFGLGGPIPLIDKFTFYISTKYMTEKYKDNGLAVKDPLGNNLGAMDNDKSWVRSMTGRLKYNITDDIRMEFGATYGVTSYEGNSWAWLYATDYGELYDGTRIEVPENRAKQNVNNQFLQQYYARINQSLTQTSFYELTFSWNNNRYEQGKRKNFDDPSLFGAFQLYEPSDAGISGYSGTKGDKIIDSYWSNSVPTITRDGYEPGNRPGRNPLTGYVEGDINQSGTKNPYGLQSTFVTHGNEDGGGGRGFELHSSDYFQVDGNFTSILSATNADHSLKTGFEFRLYSLRRHNNSLPWDGNPFFDVYTDEWGGNFYEDNQKVKDITSKPYEPISGAVYIQDQINYKGIIISPGLRLDLLDPRAKYRTDLTTFSPISQIDSAGFDDASLKLRLSPRLYIAYPITDRSKFTMSYGIFFQSAPFNNFYDAFNTFRLRGNQILGDPNIKIQNVKAYEVGYSTQLTDDFAFDVTAYYKDLYNIVGLSYVPASPSPYSVYSTGEYGNSRGVEFTFRKRPSDHIGLTLSYTLASARGTASNATSNYDLVITAGEDEFTRQKKVFPLTEYYLDYDRRHYIKAILNVFWGNDEGPSIGGLKVLEYTNINLSGFYRTGTPYTLKSLGIQQGEFNGQRQPSMWNIDGRIERDIPFKDLFGDSFGSSRITLFVDILNLLNRTEAIAYNENGSPDVDRSTQKLLGDFSAIPWYAVADSKNQNSVRADQYDTFGNRLYNPSVDTNNDGVVTQLEKYNAYQHFIADAVARRGNYQTPREVFFGAIFYF